MVEEAPAVIHPITSHPHFASAFYPLSPQSDELEAHLASGLLSTPGLGRVFGAENTSGIHGERFVLKASLRPVGDVMYDLSLFLSLSGIGGCTKKASN